MKQALLYTLKVWLTAIITGPVPFILFQHHFSWKIDRYAEYLMGALMAFSPLMLLFFLITLLAIRLPAANTAKKLIIFLPTEVLFLLFIYVLNYFFIKLPAADGYQVAAIVFFALMLCFGVFFYRLKPQAARAEEER